MSVQDRGDGDTRADIMIIGHRLDAIVSATLTMEHKLDSIAAPLHSKMQQQRTAMAILDQKLDSIDGWLHARLPSNQTKKSVIDLDSSDNLLRLEVEHRSAQMTHIEKQLNCMAESLRSMIGHAEMNKRLDSRDGSLGFVIDDKTNVLSMANDLKTLKGIVEALPSQGDRFLGEVDRVEKICLEMRDLLNEKTENVGERETVEYEEVQIEAPENVFERVVVEVEEEDLIRDVETTALKHSKKHRKLIVDHDYHDIDADIDADRRIRNNENVGALFSSLFGV